ncbi:hypothetical protein J2J97_32500 (plasmid) [Rhizobium bangladeshense]|uniref:hypothetical protein n=1 Tax=Rhizobium bangladeshense TaxID=1138189 RepID=UPI001A99120F|nr:hypothetical protein [Rhizobium bangladeshense]QSY98626.1 hypothetical protein J2J97_32500 [Rhizobium bangladeshense]
MALMVGALYDALKEAGATDEKAKKAAEEVANFDARLHDMTSDIKLMKWMVGAIFAGVAALVIKAFF